ncbi:MAG: HesA/MoeB/ThiF family protein [Candidatus Gastranaerophilales bacterium]|nr:HesA/MoeB/ThiF family protein [Candidatus Gastranaerophilales bacterium]
MIRYDRNILINEIGAEGQTKLLSAKVLICGAGGLGSTVIANLAAAGVGTIGIVDNDILELSNLNRQYIHKFANIGQAKINSAKNWIQEFNPDINIKTYNVRLDENNYQSIAGEYDLIIDCFDSFESKFLLNNIALKMNKSLIAGGVTEFRGQVTTVLPHKSACLRCLLPDADPEAYVVKGVISPTVSMIASVESMEAVKLILGTGELLTNQLLVFDGLQMNFKKLKFERNKNCKWCKDYE